MGKPQQRTEQGSSHAPLGSVIKCTFVAWNAFTPTIQARARAKYEQRFFLKPRVLAQICERYGKGERSANFCERFTWIIVCMFAAILDDQGLIDASQSKALIKKTGNRKLHKSTKNSKYTMWQRRPNDCHLRDRPKKLTETIRKKNCVPKNLKKSARNAHCISVARGR